MYGEKDGHIPSLPTTWKVLANGTLIAISCAAGVTQMFGGRGELANPPTGKRLRGSSHDSSMPQIQVWQPTVGR